MILTVWKGCGKNSMLKAAGIIIIIISSTLIGFIYGESLKKRVFQLKEIEQAILQLQSEVLYNHSSLPEVFKNISNKCSKPIGQVFMYVSMLLYENKVDSVYEGFRIAINENKDKLNIKQHDIDIILDLSKSLGESDIEGQNRILNLTLENIKKQIVSAEIAMNKDVKMYRYLGFSFGAVIAILIL